MAKWTWEIMSDPEMLERLAELESQGWTIQAVCITGRSDRDYFKVFMSRPVTAPEPKPTGLSDVQAHEGENDDVPTENGLETGSSVRNNPDIAGDVRLGGSQEVGGPQEGREELL